MSLLAGWAWCPLAAFLLPDRVTVAVQDCKYNLFRRVTALSGNSVGLFEPDHRSGCCALGFNFLSVFSWRIRKTRMSLGSENHRLPSVEWSVTVWSQQVTSFVSISISPK